MEIKKIAIGNKEEAFIEERLENKLNIIFSVDNNRGKTIVMQGLMYSLGYPSSFPNTFKYKDYYFYSKVKVKDNEYEFIRKVDKFIIKSEDQIHVLDSVRDLRYFVDKNIFSLPRILKDYSTRMVDFSLFYEIFFISQDKRNPSNIIVKGQYKKDDFINMIYSFMGVYFADIDNNLEVNNDIKSKIKRLKQESKDYKKKLTIIKANPDIAEIYTKTIDNEKFNDKVKVLKDLTGNISILRRNRQSEINRKFKLKELITELRSLNREIDLGNVSCGKCGSQKIIYSSDDLTFEISNVDVRKKIISSIEDNIIQKEEIINELSSDINNIQNKINKELELTPPNFQELVLYQDQILSGSSYDDKIIELNNMISRYQEKLNQKEEEQESFMDKRVTLLNKILDEMNNTYKEIDNNGHLVFDGIFSKQDLIYSGSDEQEYYFSRLIALNKILKHDFPILIDSFRDGELSSKKENSMIDIYSKLNKQVILTATLKEEEYIKDKYISNENINSLDYSNFPDSKILTPSYLNEFNKIIESFSLMNDENV